MKKTLIVLIILMLASAVVVAGCTSNDSANKPTNSIKPTPTPRPTPATETPTVIGQPPVNVVTTNDTTLNMTSVLISMVTEYANKSKLGNVTNMHTIGTQGNITSYAFTANGDLYVVNATINGRNIMLKDIYKASVPEPSH